MLERIKGIVWYGICWNIPSWGLLIYFIGLVIYFSWAVRDSTNENLLGEYTHRQE